MNIYEDAFLEWKDLEGVSDALKKDKSVYITGVCDSARVCMARVLSRGFGSSFFVVPSEKKAARYAEDCYLFYKDYALFPERDILFYNADIGGGLITQRRMKVYKSLLFGEKRCFVTTFGALMNSCISPGELRRRIIKIKRGDTISTDEISKKLAENGYERVYKTELPGQFALRGDILDVYCICEDNPWRVELWGDDVETIKIFDAESQRSIEEVEKIDIFPASEDFEGVAKDSAILDYLDWDETVCFLDEPVRLLEAATALEEEISGAYLGRKQSGMDDGELDNVLPPEQVFAKLSMHKTVAFSALGMRLKEFRHDYEASILSKTVSGYQNSFELLVRDLNSYRRNGYSVVILSPSRTRAERLAKDISGFGITAYYSENQNKSLASGEVMVSYGRLTQGFEFPELAFVTISEGDIFPGEKEKEKKKKEAKKRKDSIKSIGELHIGDYVVHENHGIGIYRGIEKIERDHVIKDYMKIEYAKGSNLYILATQFDMIQKYADGSGKGMPKLSSLGSNEWNRNKAKVRRAVEEIAADLVELYAKRSKERGVVYEKDTVWQREFEELFPYEETADQLTAIADVKNDMESGRVMDRLICGDVGFGKTEVALRAAFKAVQNNRQVAYLVPTTILAKQHFDTFLQRFKNYPVKIGLLCRFRTAAEQKQTVKELSEGRCDIVIGTHRLLSKDVSFKNLGLLIVDEEQRFGVSHKEKIKKLKTNVNVMSLTATPIPRTLHMSLSGIRDMSLLSEPPIDRMPIQTYVMEYHEELVREALERELARDGQVYFVYNRVDNISEIAARIQELVPEASVSYAHGQMEERELERIMIGFVDGEINVLVSTTIIETGLDIPNVNTIIICDADRFGLAQLYQLRGRVGRSNRTAYAFLMYRRQKVISEVAEKRLDAIREFTDLGSGIRIAMRDLEIRGAGNILGQSQSGHMAAVGYELYCKLLNEAVKSAKGESTQKDFETTVELSMDAYIPSLYITSESEKLDMYRRIAALENEEESAELKDELLDRFGPIPEAVEKLIWIALLKARAGEAFVVSVKETKRDITICIYPQAPMDPLKLTSMVRDYKGMLSLVPEKDNPRLLCDPATVRSFGYEAFLDTVIDRLRTCVRAEEAKG